MPGSKLISIPKRRQDDYLTGPFSWFIDYGTPDGSPAIAILAAQSESGIMYIKEHKTLTMNELKFHQEYMVHQYPVVELAPCP